MGTPNRRVRIPKTVGRSASAKSSRKSASVTAGLAKPSASAWRVLERKKGSGSERHVDEVGEVRIPSLPPRFRDDILATLARVGAEAERRDPKHRILTLRAEGRGVRVTTSENQLAVRIGKKLRDAFKGSALRISYSDEDMPIRVTWTPPTKK